MPIDLSDFAEECQRWATFFGVSAHYLVAVASRRSRVSDDKHGNLIGPFRLTAREWEAYRADPDLAEFNLVPSDINSWQLQCAVFAAMTRRAQRLLMDRLDRHPSALELYRQQWPAEPADLQRDLAETAALVSALNIATIRDAGSSSQLSSTIRLPNSRDSHPDLGRQRGQVAYSETRGDTPLGPRPRKLDHGLGDELLGGLPEAPSDDVEESAEERAEGDQAAPDTQSGRSARMHLSVGWAEHKAKSIRPLAMHEGFGVGRSYVVTVGLSDAPDPRYGGLGPDPTVERPSTAESVVLQVVLIP